MALPPEYFDPHDPHDTAEFSRACFHCPMDKVDYTLWHTLCPTHGKDSRKTDRLASSKHVRGAGRLF